MRAQRPEQHGGVAVPAAGGGPQRIFIIAGAFIDGTGEIVIMILADFNIAGQIIPRFSAVRLS